MSDPFVGSARGARLTNGGSEESQSATNQRRLFTFVSSGEEETKQSKMRQAKSHEFEYFAGAKKGKNRRVLRDSPTFFAGEGEMAHACSFWELSD